MAVNLSLTSFTTLQNDSSAVTQLNANNAAITTAFKDVLALDGTVPNQMQTNLDMNSNQILNLPSPATVNSPVRLVDVASNPTITVPPIGTSGGTVPLLNTSNTWSAGQTQTFAGPLVASNGITANSETVTGTLSANVLTVPTTSTFTGVATFIANPILPATTVIQGKQLVGTTTNDSASAGNVGEYVSSTVAVGAAVPYTTGVPTNITSITLTAGDWDVWAIACRHPAPTTSFTFTVSSIVTTSAVLGTLSSGNTAQSATAANVVGNDFSVNVGPVRFSLASTTTIFLVYSDGFTVSTNSGFGTLAARRVR